MKHLSSLTFKVLGLTVVLLLVLAVPLLSQSSFAQGPPENVELPAKSELEVECMLDNGACMRQPILTFCLPNQLDAFLAHMEMCIQGCGGQIDVTTIHPRVFCVPLTY